MTRSARGGSRPRRAQRGIILFIALIVLVAMSLAGIALMRSVDTNVLIAGNLAFRQSATMSGDQGIEAAKTWMASYISSLETDQPGVTDGGAYWANWQSSIDLYGATASTSDDYNWTSSGSSRLVGTDAAGNEIRYVIHRLCAIAGATTGGSQSCVTATMGGGTSGAAGSTKGVATYGSQALPGVSAIFYRVTVRIAGPRNTLSFVQAVLN